MRAPRRAAGAGPGGLGAKRQQGRVREELLEDGRVALDEQLAVRQVRARDVHPKTDVREHEEGLAVEVREPHVAPARQPMLRGHVGVEVLHHELVAGRAQRDAQVRVGALRIRRELRVEDEPRHELRRELRQQPARRRCCRCHRHRPLLPTQRRQVSAQRLRTRREVRGCGQRELATFFYLVAQGGVDGPATAHAGANMNLGATREFLERCVLVMVPLVGYPRSLAALAAIKNAAESRNS